MKLFISLFTILFVISCSKDSSTNKSLFSSWAADSSTTVLDLTGGSLGTFGMYFILTNQNRCNCNVSIGGSESSGNYAITSCSYVAGTGTGSDTGCSALNSSGTFTKTSSTLSICSSGTCTGYH